MAPSMQADHALRTVEWKDGRVVMIDQTKLPNKLVFVQYDNYNQVADAIRTLVVRGAPAIGVSGAFGLALAALHNKSNTRDAMLAHLEQARDTLFKTRPTAVNLVWGLDRVMDVARSCATADQIRESVISEAKTMADQDITTNMSIGRNGSALLDSGETIMTHCNAGALATVSYGTALGVVRAAKDDGKQIKMIATETRPVQQGSRLTAFELQHDGFDVSLIPDTAVGYSMANRLVDKVIVGADRITRTGHVFNKIGTYQIALMARQHGIPFYVAAPLSTIDMHTAAQDVIIEMRAPTEVTGTGPNKTAPDGISIINPAFDMTPPELITGIITENGVAAAPYEKSIEKLFKAN